ncbi:16S rRNA (cytosine(1402)-N(4))-methyltransferase RsmH [Mycolicibacterium sp. P9-64]|uniref:16S rRNA (cytosine(1402)-N(4))-methyltransferase RsmH n=1 Tax=Mycolicibacterium sp. P9-64 TaxID=2024612 RepID=UPI0011EF91AA|nr:16S rRNA (cytosine(1402)-N(4))-methyltransferase RsmH [Mycolicibacterium sp. P9-64]KAA0083658.1 16S rRNA (cytosine(1402)-N(4))-methyltransferase RsmH [Mycolicibacterium sp. P9-64]
MKLCATSFDPALVPDTARATWPLPEPALAYFPNARYAISDRDLVARATLHHRWEGAAMPPDSRDQRHGHVPVLIDRCVELLTPALTRHDATGAGAVLVDATLGAGGHAERFLTDLPGLRLVGLDRDPTALRIAGERLAPFGDRVTFVRTRYDGYWADRDDTTVDGVLFDLGVSSMQLDLAERGFSYSHDAPLDMRMDPDAPLTAAEIVNTFDAKELTRILRDFGEERFAFKIAREIVRWRARKPFTTTGELVELLYATIPAPARRTGGHPGKRTFQALRIAVNAELDSLSDAVPAAMAALPTGGRIVVMAYQSLEDKIVKGLFAAATASRTPSGLPVELPGHGPDFVALTRGAEKADDAEIELNPRSASVRLRALEKVARREVS